MATPSGVTICSVYLLFMFTPRVYIETTIPSFYHTTRTSAFAVARREWTRKWWQRTEGVYERVTSRGVVQELSSGDYPSREAALSLIAKLPKLQTSPAVGEIIAAYLRNRLMPSNPGGDALHLALASYHRCDYLLTWNCRHLANANKFGHIRRVNTALGIFVPTLVTPIELLGEYDDEDH